MNQLLFTLCALTTASAWNWRGNKENQKDSGKLCNANKTSSLNQPGICWEAMGYKRLDLSNVTAVFQPGYWEREYPEIMDFCSEKGNGTFCYRPKSQENDTCLDMAVVRCPEGIISSCRSNFICNEIMNQNVTCDASIASVFNSSFVESGQSRCQAIEDVIKLPPAQNVTTTIDQRNNTITVGSQVFGFPFAITTTVDCTFTCISSLPSGFPQPSEAMTACFNASLPYDQLIPKSTCVGPYPPGPMTTVTETFCSSTYTTPMERIATPTGVIYTSTEPSSCSMMPTNEVSQCPFGSVSSSSIITSEQSTYEIGGGYSSSMPEISPSPCESSEEISTSFEPTPSPSSYYYY